MKANLDVGTLLSIPCKVMEGAVPNEKFISCDLGEQVIEGAIPQNFVDIDKQKVVAVIYEIIANAFKIYFNGDIFKPGNPVELSRKTVEDKCEVIG